MVCYLCVTEFFKWHTDIDDIIPSFHLIFYMKSTAINGKLYRCCCYDFSFIELFTPVLVGGLSPEFERQQIFKSLQDSSKYFSRF